MIGPHFFPFGKNMHQEFERDNSLVLESMPLVAKFLSMIIVVHGQTERNIYI